LFDSEAALREALPARVQDAVYTGPAWTHVLTHKDLYLHPCQVQLRPSDRLGAGAWVAADAWPSLGLPAPIRKLLTRT